ncbi:MAG: DUF72 domain-containing protein [Acidobacteria bacterium]|nr:DUF72 domain-containing protein [Acidobacteriota bacterium]
MLPLFEEPPRSPLAERLSALAAEGICLGTSSWKYEGWLGQIYTAERYFTRGRFSKKKFEAECLAEYAETFPVVCGDFTFYQFPSDDYWRRLFASAPASLRFAFKVPEDITVRTFPGHARYGSRAGQTNDSFLNRALFEGAFLRALEPHRARVAAFIFEFGTFSKKDFAGADQFLSALDPFLASLAGDWRYAVEIRNPDYLGPEYFGVLRSHNVAHVFNAWTRMPELRHQTGLDGARTADFTLTRALLRHGRSYEDAVKRFSPYKEVQDPDPAARESIRDLIRRAREERQEAYIFVNNRLEGNAPATIQAVVEG